MVMMTPPSNHAMSLRIAQVPNSLVARALNGLIAEESATATLKMSAQAKINALERRLILCLQVTPPLKSYFMSMTMIKLLPN